MWKEAILTYFVVARNMLAGTGEKQKQLVITSQNRETYVEICSGHNE